MFPVRTFLFVAATFAVAVAFSPAALEGTWFLHAYNNKAELYRDSNCLQLSVKWFNGTTLEAKFSYFQPSGQKVLEEYIALLVTEPRISFNVLIKEKTGEYKPHCTVTGLPFNKSQRILKMISNCFFDIACISQNEIPSAADVKDMETFCPGFTKIDNTKC